MGPGYFIIAIMGCGEGSTGCTPVATAPTRYESEAACSAATTEALIANSDLEFPTIVAECRAMVRPASAERDEQPVPADALRG